MSDFEDENLSSTSHPYAQVGYDLMGACFEVHRVLGGGLLEEIYQESLEWELSLREIPFESKRELNIFYKERMLLKKYIPDLVVAEYVMVELKAVKELVSDHEAQLFNYLRIARKPVGYLVNFGPTNKVEWKRFVISDFVSKSETR